MCFCEITYDGKMFLLEFGSKNKALHWLNMCGLFKKDVNSDNFFLKDKGPISVNLVETGHTSNTQEVENFFSSLCSPSR